jgi:hypothetical protein
MHVRDFALLFGCVVQLLCRCCALVHGVLSRCDCYKYHAVVYMDGIITGCVVVPREGARCFKTCQGKALLVLRMSQLQSYRSVRMLAYDAVTAPV